MNKQTTDTRTGLELLSSMYERVGQELDKQSEIGYLFFDIVEFENLQETYGQEIIDKILSRIGFTVIDQRGKLIRDDDSVVVNPQFPGRFIIFLFSPPRKKGFFSQTDLKLVASRILQKLHDLLKTPEVAGELAESIYFECGYATMHYDPLLSIDKIIFEAHREATLQAKQDKIMVNLISNITHELRTPLTCIKGYAETLLEGAMAEPGLCQKFLKIINGEALRLEKLINDLLDLSMIDGRQIQMKCSDANILALTEEVMEVVKPYAAKSQISLFHEIGENIPKTMNIDKNRMHQALIILIDNAIKYSPAGSSVTLKIFREGKYVYISVIDKGKGIPEMEQKRIFERFYRIDQSSADFQQTGRGLGLPIAKHIVEAHGGLLQVVSIYKKGSTFTLSIPADDMDD